MTAAAYFTAVADGLQPVPEARSPWADDMLHGRLLAGLAARAVEHDDHDRALRIARLTVDMFRPPPMTPFTTRTSVARDGRRVRVVEVSIRAGEVEVAKATALLLRTAAHPPGTVWQPEPWSVPAPDAVPRMNGDTELMGGWDVRVITPGGFWSSARKQVLARDQWALVEGEVLTPVVRAALAADLPNPLANSGDHGLAFINPDLTMFVARPPESDWIGLEVSTHIGHDGIAVGSCTLYDTTGAFGTSTVCALANDAVMNG